MNIKTIKTRHGNFKIVVHDGCIYILNNEAIKKLKQNKTT